MKRIVMTIALMALVTAMKAQQEAGTWSVMPRVGVNSSNMSGWDVYTSLDEDASLVKSERKWGVTAGVEAEYLAWQQVGISFGAFYSNEGYKIPGYDLSEDGGGKITQSLHFVDIPLLVNFYIEPNMLPGLALKAGVQFGYLLKGGSKYGSTTETNTSNYTRVNVSIPAGISYEWHNLVADLRYNIGVTNLCNLSVLDETWRSNSLWLTVGYRFSL